VIEVSASTLRKDRMIKAPLYAQAGVPEYWIVDLVDTSVQVLTQPIPFGYREDHIARRGDTLRPVELPGVEILVADIPFDA
jgi:Uma2 family endonuclease